jgi:hypothetical protein
MVGTLVGLQVDISPKAGPSLRSANSVEFTLWQRFRQVPFLGCGNHGEAVVLTLRSVELFHSCFQRGSCFQV